MIPLMAVVRIRTQRRHYFRLWLPLFLVWLLVLPLVVLLVPIGFIVCLVCWLNPFRAFSSGWQLVTGLTGARVAIKNGKSRVLVHIL